MTGLDHKQPEVIPVDKSAAHLSTPCIKCAQRTEWFTVFPAKSTMSAWLENCVLTDTRAQEDR
jgi:hypothetical protein